MGDAFPDVLEGTIARKKVVRSWILLALKCDPDIPAYHVYVPKSIFPGKDVDLAITVLRTRLRVHIELGEPYKGFKTLDDGRCIYATRLKMLQCAPDPLAIRLVLESLSKLEEIVEPNVLFIDEELDRKGAQVAAAGVLAKEGKWRRLAIREVSRVLQGEEKEKKPRTRKPHIRQRDLRVLDHLENLALKGEQGWELLDSSFVSTEKDVAKKNAVNLPYEGLKEALEDNEEEVAERFEYLHEKKHPQIEWIRQRVAKLADGPLHVLDVGGGRGDLAVDLASSLEKCSVTVVDVNESSLEAGRAYAERLGVSSKTRFIYADFADYHRDPHAFQSGIPTSPPVNLVTALHACGDLSDLAVEHAKTLSCAFLVCPCCYTKRYITEKGFGFEPGWFCVADDACKELMEERCDKPQTGSIVLGRLAELNDDMDVGSRARRIINSIRLSESEYKNVDGGNSAYRLSYEEYENASSSRNLVLVGMRQNRVTVK